MSGADTSPAVITLVAQKMASDPEHNVWVTANAGSGKTQVLANRVARLLYRGAPPHRILCLTYTRAAAAEMRDRLVKQLGKWALLDEFELAKSLGSLGISLSEEREEREASLIRARRLFAQALETPGGLRIQTIHAFCQATLQRFPFEAGVPPNFSPLDERKQREILTEALELLAKNQPEYLAAISAYVSDRDFDKFLLEIVQARHSIESFSTVSADLADREIESLFNISPTSSPESIIDNWFSELASDDIGCLLAAVKKCLDNSPADREKSWRVKQPKLQALHKSITAKEPLVAWEHVCSLLLTKEGKLVTEKSAVPTKAIQEISSRTKDISLTLREEFARSQQQIKRLSAGRRTLALARFAASFLQHYDKLKREQSAIDFDDLINLTARLLTSAEHADWVRYRMDWQVDHILVDEGQDTNRKQWKIIEALTEEFFAGEGAHDYRRTIFAVGDYKQSIYGFQGAEPVSFLRAREIAKKRIAATGAELVQPSLHVSFRSAQAILDFVDEVVALTPHNNPQADAENIPHFSSDENREGRVDLWPLLEAPDKAKSPIWYEIGVAPEEEKVKRLLARRLAHEIARMIGKELLPGEKRTVRAGDIMVLVRSRDILAETLVEQLQQLLVPVAGRDRMLLLDQLAVRDLLALAQFALTPEDDYSLACLLRSPICHFDDDDLFALAHQRQASLWSEIQMRATEKPHWQKAQALLSDMIGRAETDRPYEFFKHAFAKWSVRHNLIARLGDEISDPIDELLERALAYESEEAPTLQGFLGWILRFDTEIKRDLTDKHADHVRVMTIHAAKGLESPIVILPDLMHRPTKKFMPFINIVTSNNGREIAIMRASASQRSDVEESAVEKWQQAEIAEQQRLLYVAITRASHWLIMCGAGAMPKKEKEKLWYFQLQKAMENLQAIQHKVSTNDGQVILRYQTGVKTSAASEDEQAEIKKMRLPEWTKNIPVVEKPSSATETESTYSAVSAVTEPAEDRSSQQISGAVTSELALHYGRLIHMLLEKLPDIQAKEWTCLGTKYLNEYAPELSSEKRRQLLNSALKVLNMPEMKPLLVGRISEAGLYWSDNQEQLKYGRADLISFENDVVSVVDFKTDAKPPTSNQEIPSPYYSQLRAYQSALGKIYPKQLTRAGLLWVNVPRLDWLA